MKKGLQLFTMVLVIMSFVACGAKSNTATEDEKDKQIAELQEQIAELQEQSGKTDTDVSSGSDANKVVDERTAENETPIEVGEDSSLAPTLVNIGDTVSTDFVEITFDAVKTADEIKPDNPAQVYRYQADQENETYLYIVGTIKNTSGDSYEFADSSYTKIVFDDKYNYSGVVTADEGGDFSYIYASLKPFQSEKVYWVFSVPDELIGQYTKATVLIGFNENFEDDWYKDIDTCDYRYMISVTK